MIDRQRYSPLLHPRVLRAAAATSAVACVVCPMIALIFLLVACISFVVLQGAYCVVLLLSWVGFIIGGALAVVGLFAVEENPGILGGGILGILLGYGLSALAPSLNIGQEAFAAVVAPGGNIMDWFINSRVFIWTCVPCAVVLAAATVTMTVMLFLRYVPDFVRARTRRHTDCPSCHHRGRVAYACPNCGSIEADLRPSVHGIFFVRCVECGNQVPTLDLFGRDSQTRSCGRCNSALANKNIGRCPVVHIALVKPHGEAFNQTTLHVVTGHVVFCHECALLDIASPTSAAAHTYLMHLDIVVIHGDGPSLRQHLAHGSGLVRTLERASLARIGTRSRTSVVLVRSGSEPLAPYTPPVSDSLADWSELMRRAFRQVTTWQGEFTAAALRQIISR